MKPFPKSIAIAGAWGYIGRKFLSAAASLDLQTFAYDSGVAPVDVDLEAIKRIEDEELFYRTKADIFHLAVQPEHRRRAEKILLERAATESILILNEKPMAPPSRPEQCEAVIDAVDRAGASMLYDFPELYDSMTERIIVYLSRFSDLRITEMTMCRSKDRESRDIPRNYKRMVTIQYQESVHCLAFVLYVLSKLKGNLASAFADEVSIAGESEPYDPPNPEAYPHVVDGRCRYSLSIGEIRVDGLTDFKANAPWSKRRVIRGVGDGRPFRIEADYLEGQKRLEIDGVDQRCDPEVDSYRRVITTASRWHQQVPRVNLMHGVYPNPRFARATYRISSALWRSCRSRKELRFRSLDDLVRFEADFAAEVPELPRY